MDAPVRDSREGASLRACRALQWANGAQGTDAPYRTVGSWPRCAILKSWKLPMNLNLVEARSPLRAASKQRGERTRRPHLMFMVPVRARKRKETSHELGRDAFHRVRFFAPQVADAVEGVPTSNWVRTLVWKSNRARPDLHGYLNALRATVCHC